jgi:hypothetical protein
VLLNTILFAQHDTFRLYTILLISVQKLHTIDGAHKKRLTVLLTGKIGVQSQPFSRLRKKSQLIFRWRSEVSTTCYPGPVGKKRLSCLPNSNERLPVKENDTVYEPEAMALQFTTSGRISGAGLCGNK